MAKKIMALVTAIALVVCFAVSASAAVLTTTSYVTGTNDIKVNVTVTGVSEGANVTYYATKSGADVHIDQAKAGATGATFEFNTAATNLDSTVVIGYTGADEAITGNTIKGFTVTYPNGSKVIPTEATSVVITYTPESGKVFDGVTVTAGTATIASATPTANAGEVSVVFDAKLTENVTLAVAQKVEKDAPTATAMAIEAAAIISDGSIDGTVNGEERNPDDHEDTIAANADKAGDRKLTVIGKVASAQAYGIIVSESEITTGVIDATAFNALTSYAGATKNADGLFAIQLIDTSDANSAEAFVKVGTKYYTAVYALDANGDYVITAGGTATATVKAN